MSGPRWGRSAFCRVWESHDPNENDREPVKLMEGEISRVFLEENGYWCYKIIKSGGGVDKPLTDGHALARPKGSFQAGIEKADR
ncbi:MAG: hypothetical protein GQ559_04370 [Desulfobulbaceae bacterium]|nr:hypothetical protein [Desulfobulbaceae bacterium]